MAVQKRSPLTQTMGHNHIEVDPEALPLGDSLRSSRAQWKASFETTLSGWPASGGFDSEHDAESFVAAGRRLVLQLQDDLGAGYHVEYMPEPTRPPGVKTARPVEPLIDARRHERAMRRRAAATRLLHPSSQALTVSLPAIDG